MPLEDHYAGNEAFEKYSNCFSSYWDSFEHQEELLNIVEGDLVIAKAIAYHMGSNFRKWMLSRPPVLEGLSPIECMKTEQGKNKLKCCLHRMP